MSMQARSHLLVPAGIGHKRALVIGAGTVGSNVAHALCGIGLRDLTIVDYDEVGIHNLPSQVFTSAQVGYSKAESLASNLMDRFGLDGLTVTAVHRKFDNAFTDSGFDIIVSAADSMTVRKTVAMWARGTDARLIDSRCAGHEIQTWAYDTASREQYDAYTGTLYSDSEASGLPCGGEMYPAAGLVAAVATLAAVSTTEFFYRVSDTELGVVTAC